MTQNPFHADHVRRARAAYDTFVREFAEGLGAPWDALPERTKVAWIKAAGVAARDALTSAADRLDQRDGPGAELAVLIREQADDVVCYRLAPQ